MVLSIFATTAGYVVYLLPLALLTNGAAVAVILTFLNAIFAGEAFKVRWALVLLIISLVMTALVYAMLVAEKLMAKPEHIVTYIEKPVPVSTVSQITPVVVAPVVETPIQRPGQVVVEVI
jgi:hypothetical protein